MVARVEHVCGVGLVGIQGVLQDGEIFALSGERLVDGLRPRPTDLSILERCGPVFHQQNGWKDDRQGSARNRV